MLLCDNTNWRGLFETMLLLRKKKTTFSLVNTSVIYLLFSVLFASFKLYKLHPFSLLKGKYLSWEAVCLKTCLLMEVLCI